MALAAVLCCAMTTTVFTSCSSEENHPVTYRYEVRSEKIIRPYNNEATLLQKAFNSAVGTNGTVYTHYQENQDSKMKSACDAVKKQYTNINSVYLKFDLVRIAAAVGSQDVSTVIASYEFGMALTMPYVYYSIVTNRDEAYAALEAKKATLDEETYNASLETLKALVGKYTVTTTSSGVTKKDIIYSKFEAEFAEDFKKAWLDNETSTQSVNIRCNSIADEHISDVLAVDVVVSVVKTGVLNKQVGEVWKKTFPANQ